jgi:hypothetical protein
VTHVARRRIFLTVLAWAGAPRAADAPAPRASVGSVYVFAVLDLRPHVLQKLLEELMPGVNVTVFGRIGDFSRALVDTPPDATLALAPV